MILKPIQMSLPTNIQEPLDRVVNTSNADVLIYNGPLERPRDRNLISRCCRRRCRPNLFMILVTNGGEPDAAYRMARCFQRRYRKFTVCLSGPCKSAGTLLLIGAHELAFYEHGELGPLDIQLAKKDELWESESGLTTMTALSALHQNAQDAFDHFLIAVTTRSGGRITARTASEIAAKLTQALYAPISEQIDPIHMGEVYRSMAIAREYGTRLLQKSKNCDEETLNELISSYPSHGFVIDKEEAHGKFKNVRDCTKDEAELIEALGELAFTPSAMVSRFISKEVEEQDENCQSETVLEQPEYDRSFATTTGDISANGQGVAATDS